MEKFLKITVDGSPVLIPVSKILHVELSITNSVKILYDLFWDVSGSAQGVGIQLDSLDVNNSTKGKEQLNALVNQIEAALATPWTKPIYDITSKLPYTISSIEQLDEVWGA